MIPSSETPATPNLSTVSGAPAASDATDAKKFVLEGTRFGRIEVEDARLISIPTGLVGFPTQTRYVLLERDSDSAQIAWLQSLDTPALAFPVMDGAAFGADYPNPAAKDLAIGAGLGGEDVALLIVVVARPLPPRLVANLLAPIVVDMKSRRGAQVVLDPRRYSAAVPVVDADQSESSP